MTTGCRDHRHAPARATALRRAPVLTAAFGLASVLTVALGLAPGLAVALAVGCAGRLGPSRASEVPVAVESDLGWRALVEGRDGDAASHFRARLAQDSGDVLALFGDASLAFERGDSARAIGSYVALLERAASAPDQLSPVLASMATGRVFTLLDEHPGPPGVRRVIEDRLLALSPSKLPWEARYGLAVLVDRIERRRGDPDRLGRAARAAGCLRSFTVERPAGNLPHVDLDSSVVGQDVARTHLEAVVAGKPVVPRGGRAVEALGCVVSVPAFDGRPSAERIFADIEVPAAGVYDVVLEFQGEARVIVDGGTPFRHGDEYRYGPRVTATRVALSRGRHQVELRLAAFGGHPNLVVMVIPVNSDDSGDAAKPSVGEAPVPSPSVLDAAAVITPVAELAERNVARAVSPSLSAAMNFAGSYISNRLGDAERSWAAGQRLETARRFALGLALAAALAHDDPSRPANFGRDRARTLLSAAVAIDPGLGRARNALSAIALDDDRPREAVDQALAATKASPGWWLPELTLHAAYRLRGLEWDADRNLDQAIAHGRGACSVIEAALGRAEDRRDLNAEARFSAELDACGKDSDQQIERMRRKGDLAGAEAALAPGCRARARSRRREAGPGVRAARARAGPGSGRADCRDRGSSRR